MLEPFRLVVHAIPVVAKLFNEIDFQDAMAPNHLQRGMPSLSGELHPAIGDVLD